MITNDDDEVDDYDGNDDHDGRYVVDDGGGDDFCGDDDEDYGYADDDADMMIQVIVRHVHGFSFNVAGGSHKQLRILQVALGDVVFCGELAGQIRACVQEDERLYAVVEEFDFIEAADY